MGRLGEFVASSLLGVMGGYLGTILSLAFFEEAWGVQSFGIWVLSQALDRISSPLIIIAIAGGVFGGTTTQKWWGAFGGGFFLTILGFYYFKFFLPQMF